MTIYVDAAASALKSRNVISSEMNFLSTEYANAGRGICARATHVDDLITEARNTVANFIGASSPDQIIFTSGTTDGMNRIAKILDVNSVVGNTETILVSDIDHHSARMPFEELCHDGKCRISVCKIDDEFNIIPEKCDVFIITAMSNVLGNAQNVKKIIADARKLNPSVITIVDAAQYVAHEKINVTDWDCDFLCFSGHKIGADTGIGVMYIKKDRWDPDKFGGGMIASITGSLATNDSHWTLHASPAKFEAGTLPITQIIGLNAAINELKTPNQETEHLTRILRSKLSENKHIKFISPEKSHLLTFTLDNMHALDFGAMVGAHNVCLRVGHMCASWLHKYLNIDHTIRISLGPWNTESEIHSLIDIINNVINSNH